MLKILKYLTKKDWLLVLYSFAFVIVQVYLDLKLPDYMSEITMLVQTPNSEMGDKTPKIVAFILLQSQSFNFFSKKEITIKTHYFCINFNFSYFLKIRSIIVRITCQFNI